MNDKIAIEIKNLTKSFRSKVTVDQNHKRLLSLKPMGNSKDHIVLDDISFNVRKGEVIGILGRNGSGKSTLLKIISRILEPDSGIVNVNGKIASILELGMGFHPDMTGRENIFLKGAMYGFSKGEIQNRLDSIIDYSGIGEYIDNPLRTYSSGMIGRLAYAIMVNVDADIFLVDEILSVGDVSFSAKAAEHFRNAAKNGKTILIVSHSISSITEMCSKAIWIEDGKVRESGVAKVICEHYRREMTESFDITSELAEAGVIDSQYRLACMYRDGKGVEADSVIAFKWMEKAAEQRHIQAQVEYADMLFDGIGTEEDTMAAIQYYQMAADKGNNDARIKVASLVGFDIDSDREEVLYFFKRLAEEGNPVNEYRYADLLLKTAWNEKDREEAFNWFLSSANKGNLNAKYQTAIMYRDGIGTKTDFDSYTKMLRGAAESGYSKAQLVLAEILLSGNKSEENEIESFKWYLQSAKTGNTKAQYQVAIMYRDGIGVDIDSEESKKWFRIFSCSSYLSYQILAGDILKNVTFNNSDSEIMYERAALLNSPLAMYKLGMQYRDKISKINMDTAIKWLSISADCNNLNAQVALGDIYLKGIGVERDIDKAFHYFERASLNGNATASYKIAMMYKEGLGVEIDKNKYYEYLKFAFENGNSDATLELIRFKTLTR